MTRTFLYQPKEETTVGSFMAADSHFSLFTHTWHHSFIKYSLNLSSSRVFVFISCCCWMNCHKLSGLPTQLRGKESACNAEDLGSIPRLGRSLRERKGYPLLYSGLENALDRIVHRVAKSWTQLSDFHFHSLSCVWLCNPMDCSTPGLPVLHFLLELVQIRIHWADDAL